MVFEDEYYELYCEKCEEEYTNKDYRWCKPCLINDCKNNFTKWTSGNEKMDNFIQEMQLKIDSYSNIIFEWIPYDQLNIIKELSKSGFAIIYLAVWKDGSLSYNYEKRKYTRNMNTKVALKCLHNSQNINEFLNKVWIF
jgi:hypothetical protein